MVSLTQTIVTWRNEICKEATRASAFTFLNHIDHFGTFFATVNKLRKRCAPFWRSRAKNPGCMGEQHPEG
ncbi:MAG: hypothetical protein LBT33_08875, partial [Spirochaetia bacterium]|nr:hypothetical protein [Spirochaetia bacterium]